MVVNYQLIGIGIVAGTAVVGGVVDVIQKRREQRRREQQHEHVMTMLLNIQSQQRKFHQQWGNDDE